MNDLRERGVLTGRIGPDENILKLRPPMVLQEAEAEFVDDGANPLLPDVLEHTRDDDAVRVAGQHSTKYTGSS